MYNLHGLSEPGTRNEVDSRSFNRCTNVLGIGLYFLLFSHDADLTTATDNV